MPAAAAAAADLNVPPGTATTQSGTVQGNVTLGAGSTLNVASHADLTVYGTISGPDAPATPGTVAVADGATLFAAGPVTAGVVVRFSTNGTLDVAGQSLGNFAGTVAGLAPGDVLDITSSTFTAASLAPLAGGTGLTLLDDGVAMATLRLAEASGPGLLVAVSDGVDGTLILAGPAVAPPVATAAPGTRSGASFLWQGTGGLWGDAAHWGGRPAPGAADTVRIAGPSNALLPIAGAAAAAALLVGGDVALAGSFTLGSLAVAGDRLDTLDLLAGATLVARTATLDGGSWQVAGASASVGGTATISNGILSVVDGGTLTSGAMALAGAVIRVDATGSITVGAGPATQGALAVVGGGTVSGFGMVRCAVEDDGVLFVQGGTLTTFGTIAGAGKVVIGGHGTLFAAAGVAGSVAVAFQPASAAPGSSGSGTLELFASTVGFTGTLAGMQPGDALDFASGTVSQAAWTPPGPNDGGIGVLDLGAAGRVEIAVGIGVNSAAAAFEITSDGAGGGSRVTMVPCFVAGTRLATPCGEVPVEAIQAGDLVLAGNGGWRRVRWTGRAHHPAAALRTGPQLRPVRFGAGALGLVAGLPTPIRPLLLSPQHALLLAGRHGDILVPAVALVDGRTVTRCSPAAGVTYFHVELDSHDVVLAEGALVETYLPDTADSDLLFETPRQRLSPASKACRSRVESGQVIVALRRRLGLATPVTAPGPARLRGNLERAVLTGGKLRIEGWATDNMAPGAPVQVEIMHDGVPCARATANLWRPDLDRAGLAGGSCGFAAELAWRAADLHGRLSVRQRA